MQLDSSQAESQSQYQGQAYHFGSEECKRLFDETQRNTLTGKRRAKPCSDEQDPRAAHAGGALLWVRVCEIRQLI